MGNKPEARLVHDEADLDSLVEGDRVILNLLPDYDYNQDEFSASVAYGGCVGRKVIFLGRNLEDKNKIDEFSPEIKNLSFYPDGTIVVSLARSRWNFYDRSSPKYPSKLAQLKKAGI